jgi:hypothetical protein
MRSVRTLRRCPSRTAGPQAAGRRGSRNEDAKPAVPANTVVRASRPLSRCPPGPRSRSGIFNAARAGTRDSRPPVVLKRTASLFRALDEGRQTAVGSHEVGTRAVSAEWRGCFTTGGTGAGGCVPAADEVVEGLDPVGTCGHGDQ